MVFGGNKMAKAATDPGPGPTVEEPEKTASPEKTEPRNRVEPREDALVIPKKNDYERDFFEEFKKDKNLFANLIDLDFHLFNTHKAYRKAYRHYTVFATVMTMIVLICTSMVVVFEVFETNSWVSNDAARGIVAVLAFVATVFTGWLSYSGAEGKAALLKEQMKSIQGLEIRVRQLTKHHIPGTITVAHAAIEIEKIKKEQVEIHRNGADPALIILQFDSPYARLHAIDARRPMPIDAPQRSPPAQ